MMEDDTNGEQAMAQDSLFATEHAATDGLSWLSQEVRLSALEADLGMGSWLSTHDPTSTTTSSIKAEPPAELESPVAQQPRRKKRLSSGEYAPLVELQPSSQRPAVQRPGGVGTPVAIPFPEALSDKPNDRELVQNAHSLGTVLSVVKTIQQRLESARQQLQGLNPPFTTVALTSEQALEAVAYGSFDQASFDDSGPVPNESQLHACEMHAESQGLSDSAAVVASLLYSLRHSVVWTVRQYDALLDSRLLLPSEIAAIKENQTELRLLSLQGDIYTRELAQLAALVIEPSTLACLAIHQQPYPCSVKQNKAVNEATTLKILVAARASLEPLTQCKAIVVAPPTKSKKQIVTVTNDEVGLDASLQARFGALTFPTGSRLKSVQLKFGVQLSFTIDAPGAVVTTGSTTSSGRRRGGRTSSPSEASMLQLESELSGDLIIKTNENQWDECEGTLLRLSVWRETEHVSWFRFCNLLQLHYIKATRQDIGSPVRPLGGPDFAYIRSIKFNHTAQTVSADDFKRVWEWFGPYMHRIRYQRHLCALWNAGYIMGFLDRPQTEAILLRTNTVGCFLLRFSERVPGQFAVSYVVDSGNQLTVRHYLVRDTDTAGAKKTLPDFLREYKEFVILLTLTRDNSGRRCVTLVDKNTALNEYYSKKQDTAFEGYEDVIAP